MESRCDTFFVCFLNNVERSLWNAFCLRSHWGPWCTCSRLLRDKEAMVKPRFLFGVGKQDYYPITRRLLHPSKLLIHHVRIGFSTWSYCGGFVFVLTHSNWCNDAKVKAQWTVWGMEGEWEKKRDKTGEDGNIKILPYRKPRDDKRG